MNLVRVFVDFHNADRQGRVRLNTKGTFEDIETKKITLEKGLKLLLDDHEGLQTEGVVEFSENENIWVARIDWDQLK